MPFANDHLICTPSVPASTQRRAPKDTRPRPGRILDRSFDELPSAGQIKKRCTCGSCAMCLENERWERIFQEKFADPNYYRSSTVRHPSCLAN